MLKLRPALHVAAAAVLVAVIAIPLAFQFSGSDQPGTAKKKEGLFPSGQQIYGIAQAADVWPRLLEARIDPVDTHVGQIQTIEVTVESRAQVDRVYARIATDNKVFDLPLEYVRDVAAEDLKIKRNKLELVGRGEGSGTAIAHAQENVTRALYRGSWTVHDVHNTTYEMVIGAKAGEDESSVTMSWTDACGIPMGGSYTISTPCNIAAADGVDNGNLTISSSLTLDANFAFNSGNSFTLSGSGSIAICASCQILKTNIYMVDQDSDNYPASFTMYLQGSAPTNGRRRNLLVANPDCDDTNASVNVSCTTNYWPDSDEDGYFSVSSVESCPKSTACATSQGDDCYDASASVYPGQSNFYTTDRGDSSFDYNCDSTEEYEYGYITGSAWCANEAGDPYKEYACVAWNTGWEDNNEPYCGNTGNHNYGPNACVPGPGPECVPGDSVVQACR